MPKPFANIADHAAEIAQFLVVEAGGRLVEQQQFRRRGQRAAELDALLQAEGQGGDRNLRLGLELQRTRSARRVRSLSARLFPRGDRQSERRCR